MRYDIDFYRTENSIIEASFAWNSIHRYIRVGYIHFGTRCGGSEGEFEPSEKQNTREFYCGFHLIPINPPLLFSSLLIVH